MFVITKIEMDLQKSGQTFRMEAVQNDCNTRCLEVALSSGGEPWSIPEDAVASMRYRKLDGTQGYYDKLPDGSQAWSISGNVLSMILAPQMLTGPGTVIAQLELMQSSSVLATGLILVSVTENPSAGIVVSEDYFNWTQWMEKKLIEQLQQMLDSNALVGPAGEPATLISAVVAYQTSTSGTIIPSGEWVGTVPNVVPGHYLWTKNVYTFNSGDPVIQYSVSRFGMDGSGAVSSVAGMSPDANGNVGLSASNVGAVCKKGDSMEGPLDMNGHTLSGLNAPASETEPVTLGYAEETYVSKEYADTRNPYNHIDNSNFTQFVAQAGIGGKHGAQAYAGDRWILDSGIVTGEANANGNGYSNITLNGTIRQIVANPPDMGTISVEMVSGTAEVSYANGEVTIISAGGVIKNAVLYEGSYTADNMPKYQPKGYVAELAKCQQYLQKCPDYMYFQCVYKDANRLDVQVNLHNPMRTGVLPSCTLIIEGIDGWAVTTGGYSMYRVGNTSISHANLSTKNVGSLLSGGTDGFFCADL